MKKLFNLFVSSSALAAVLALSGNASAFQTKKEKTAPPAATAPAATPAATPAAAPAAGAPSEKEIADAKAKGLVWVNTNSKVYHKDGEFYGKTKQGKFMAEPDAEKAGFRAAKESPIGKKKAEPKK